MKSIHKNYFCLFRYLAKPILQVANSTTFLYNNNGEKPEKIQMYLESQQV